MGWYKAGETPQGQYVELEAGPHLGILWRSYNLTSDILPQPARIDARYCCYVVPKATDYTPAQITAFVIVERRGEDGLGCHQ